MNKNKLEEESVMKHYMIYLTVLGLLSSLYGCTASYRIQVIDGPPRQVVLTYSKGADVNVGDIFILYHIQPAPPPRGREGHGEGRQPATKHEMARVQVVSVIDDSRAVVKVLSGQVEHALEAERLK